MNLFLRRVLEEKREALRRAGPATGAGPRARDFRAALSGARRIIAEIKKRSPSTPAYLRSEPPAELAKIYTEAGASAISIVTDEKNFGTSLRDVAAVRGAAPLPVLVKDFIIDERQILEARAAGADAVLLIARIVEGGRLLRLLDTVRRLGIHALVECHDAADLEKALDAGAEIVGLNNRDLDTLDVSLDTSRSLLPMIPDGAVRVVESGIKSRAEVEELTALGAHAFLIGTSLLNAADAAAKLRSFLEVAHA